MTLKLVLSVRLSSLQLAVVLPPECICNTANSIIVASRHNVDRPVCHEQHSLPDTPPEELAQRRADTALRASFCMGYRYEATRTARYVAVQLHN